jgi:hypothetical protein
MRIRQPDEKPLVYLVSQTVDRITPPHGNGLKTGSVGGFAERGLQTLVDIYGCTGEITSGN